MPPQGWFGGLGVLLIGFAIARLAGNRILQNVTLMQSLEKLLAVHLRGNERASRSFCDSLWCCRRDNPSASGLAASPYLALEQPAERPINEVDQPPGATPPAASARA
jgi:hypothetical protein